jgi:hypothetical protein
MAFSIMAFRIITFSTMTFSIMAFSTMTFSIMAFGIMTFSIMAFGIMTFSIMVSVFEQAYVFVPATESTLTIEKTLTFFEICPPLFVS